MHETRKLDFLKAIERTERINIEPCSSQEEKYFVTFPYPYMNGRLHLGHLFSFSKSEFMARYMKLRGYNVLLPFGFHCTGMPIAASAQKLSEELERNADNINRDISTKLDNLVLKTDCNESVLGNNISITMSQTDILRSMNITDINKFIDPYHWIKTFPGYAKQSLSDFNAYIDWRRSFVTTEYNIYYDSFVKWQFKKLENLGLLKFGKRYSIFCTKDNQACLDHDRSKGEGVNPIGINLLRLELVHKDQKKKVLEKYSLNLCVPIITIGRPMFVEIPEGTKFQGIIYDDVILFVESNVYYNLQYQVDNLIPFEVVDAEYFKNYIILYNEDVVELRIKDGVKKIFTKIKKLKENESSSKDVSENNVLEVEIKILEEMAEFKTSKDMNISDRVFRYYEPEDEVISRSGSKCVVSLLDQWFIDYANKELKEKGFECINKMNITGKAIKESLLEGMGWIGKWAFSRNFGLGTTYKGYLIDSLSDSTIYTSFYCYKHLLFKDIFGKEEILNSKYLGYDLFEYIYQDLLLECKYDLKCLCKCNITGESKTKDHHEGCCIKVLEECRKEINYWYPVNLRVSGKDLIRNHLQFFILNHVALFKEEYWPRKIECNGHLLLNAEKMSKSTGNYLNADDTLKNYGESVTRLTLAQCGDTIDDANFSLDTAESIIFKLHAFAELVSNYYTNASEIRGVLVHYKEVNGKQEFINNFLLESVVAYTKIIEDSYENMNFRDVIKFGFYEMLNDYELYLSLGGKQSDLIVGYLFKSMVIILQPIIPSLSAHLSLTCDINIAWSELTISEIGTKYIDSIFYIKKLIKTINRNIRKHNDEITNIVIKVSEDYLQWQKEILDIGTDSDQVREILAKYDIQFNIGMEFCNEINKKINRIDEYRSIDIFKDYIEDQIKKPIIITVSNETFPMNPKFTIN